MGVASPSAHGQAMMSTETAAISAKVRRGSGPTAIQTTKATQAAANDVVDATAQQTAALQDELGALRRDLTDGLAAIAGSTGKTASILRNVTDAGGGNSIQMNMAV